MVQNRSMRFKMGKFLEAVASLGLVVTLSQSVSQGVRESGFSKIRPSKYW